MGPTTASLFAKRLEKSSLELSKEEYEVVLENRITRWTWSSAGHHCLSGSIESTRVDLAALALTPLSMEEPCAWDPDQHYWGEEGDPIEAWAARIGVWGVVFYISAGIGYVLYRGSGPQAPISNLPPALAMLASGGIGLALAYFVFGGLINNLCLGVVMSWWRRKHPAPSSLVAAGLDNRHY